MTRSLALGMLVIGSFVVSSALGCSKEDEKPTAAAAKSADAAPAVAAPKNLDLAKAALVAAKAKYAKHEVVDADCAPIRSLEADFAGDKTPDAVKTTKEIDAFCEVDVKLEGEVATLKTDSEKLAAAQKAKNKAGEQMYAATVKDGCTSVQDHLAKLATDHLDSEPKVAPLKADVDKICAAPATPAKK